MIVSYMSLCEVRLFDCGGCFIAEFSTSVCPFCCALGTMTVRKRVTSLLVQVHFLTCKVMHVVRTMFKHTVALGSTHRLP